MATLIFYTIAYAQELIPCPDGSMADPKIGCVGVPGNVVNPESNLVNLILQIASYVMMAAAGLATAMLIYGAIRYATAAGDQEQIDRAKRVLFWSIFGLILSGIALLVVQASGMQREDFLTDHPPLTSGNMGTIIGDQVFGL